LVVGLGGESVSLAWPEFSARRASAFVLESDGTFTLHLLAEPLTLHAGQRVRRRLLLQCGESRRADVARPWVVPRRARDSSPAEDERAWLDEWKAFLSGWLAANPELPHRGCYPTAWGGFANGEYDLGGSLLELGMEEADAEWLRIG